MATFWDSSGKLLGDFWETKRESRLGSRFRRRGRRLAVGVPVRQLGGRLGSRLDATSDLLGDRLGFFGAQATCKIKVRAYLDFGFVARGRLSPQASWILEHSKIAEI